MHTSTLKVGLPSPEVALRASRYSLPTASVRSGPRSGPSSLNRYANGGAESGDPIFRCRMEVVTRTSRNPAFRFWSRTELGRRYEARGGAPRGRWRYPGKGRDRESRHLPTGRIRGDAFRGDASSSFQDESARSCSTSRGLAQPRNMVSLVLRRGTALPGGSGEERATRLSIRPVSAPGNSARSPPLSSPTRGGPALVYSLRISRQRIA